jgi:hypothetical protein
MSTKQTATPGPDGPASNEPFIYTTRSGKSITLPSLAKPFKTAGEMRKMRHLSAVDLAWTIIERECTKEQLAIVDAMEFDEFAEDLSVQWIEHSGISTGE